MQVEGRNPLEFDAVVRRFADSSEALADVRVQLQVLGDLREIEEKASASLQETAVQVARFVADAADILTGLEQAQAKVAEVLKLGSDLLDGTELKGIAESIMANSRAISAVDGRMEALESSVAESIMANSQAISAVDGRMEALESSVAESIMANSQAISAVDGRMEALESSVAESIMANSQAISAVDCRIEAVKSSVAKLAAMVGALQTTIQKDIDSLSGEIKSVHADVKTPIVRRLFR